MNATEKKAVLVLSDGSVYYGYGFGSLTTREGELVFNTSMTGYQESLTDPSYAGQILVETYPLIGNYGINDLAFESPKVHVEGFAIRNLCDAPHHYQSTKSLDKFLEDAGVPGIWGLDTRSIVRKLRNSGVMPACITTYAANENPDIAALLTAAKKLDYSKIDFVEKVTLGKAQTHGKGNKKVVLLDCGAKGGIVHELNARGVQVIAMPAFSKADEILSFSPDGICVSNGPGDPARLESISNELKRLFHLPMFGICLGNQLLGQAAGAKTYKLKFGHRGANHPVLDKKANKVVITTQNHGYSVTEKGLGDFEVTHINCNDNSIEGIAHKELPIFAVQYHPEANPGPCDSKYLFDKFVKSL